MSYAINPSIPCIPRNVTRNAHQHRSAYWIGALVFFIGFKLCAGALMIQSALLQSQWMQVAQIHHTLAFSPTNTLEDTSHLLAHHDASSDSKDDGHSTSSFNVFHHFTANINALALVLPMTLILIGKLDSHMNKLHPSNLISLLFKPPQKIAFR
jgi:hypothetical protein